MSRRFGVHLGPTAVSPDVLRDLWGRVDDAGFDWISVWDHWTPDLTATEGSYDAVAAHMAMALSTRRATCGALVYSITHRNPALLANAIATIDRFSGGRAALGIGIGWSAAEHRSYGIPMLPVADRFDALEEWLPCLRRLLDGETVTFHGRHARLEEARVAVGTVQPRVPIWVGGTGERRTIPLAARYADGWNAPAGLSPEEVAHKVSVVRGACEAMGRDPSSIMCAANALLPWDAERASDVRSGSPSTALVGSVEEVASVVERYFDAGTDQVNFSYLPEWGSDGIDRAAELLALLR